jgi:SWI/SNF-related matrix-associated actin-dependent regulator 1 of chromatin subfamily A
MVGKPMSILHKDTTRYMAYLESDYVETKPHHAWMRDVGARWNAKKEVRRWELPLNATWLGLFIQKCRERGIVIVPDAEMKEWMSRRFEKALSLTPSSPTPKSNTKPMSHQIIGTHYLLWNDRCMLLDDMGLGKTKQAIDAACNSEFERVVVICPNSVKEVWEDEIEKHAGKESRTYIGNGSVKSRIEKIRSIIESNRPPFKSIDWIILNYECIRRMTQTFWDACRGQILICDEAHRLKNGRAQVTEIVTAATPARVWLLTGTPVANRPEDLWSLCNIVCPGLLGFRWYNFEERHIIRDYNNAIAGYKGLQEIKSRLATVSLGRKKEQCIDLPEKVFEKRVVDLSGEERRAYTEMHKNLRTWLNGMDGTPTVSEAKEFSTRFLRLRQITDGLVSEGIDGRKAWCEGLSKINEALTAWNDAGRPRAVFWFQWVDVLKKAHELMDSWDALIYGGVDVEERARRISEWRTQESGVLMCQMQTGGEGLNLQDGNFQVFIDLPTTPRQRNQCIDRLHRIGQRQTVTVVDVVARNTVDQGILRMLEKKMEWVDETVATGRNLAVWKEVVG